jgi:hypothetical protein
MILILIMIIQRFEETPEVGTTGKEGINRSY